MQDNDRLRFQRLFREMAACYPGAPVTQENGEAYWQRLRSYRLDAVRKAMVKASSENPKFFPTAIMVEQHAMAFEKTGNHNPAPAGLLTGEVEKEPELSPDNYYEKLAKEWETNPPRHEVGLHIVKDVVDDFKQKAAGE